MAATIDKRFRCRGCNAKLGRVERATLSVEGPRVVVTSAGTIDYDRLAGALASVAGESTHITVNGPKSDEIAADIERAQYIRSVQRNGRR